MITKQKRKDHTKAFKHVAIIVTLIMKIWIRKKLELLSLFYFWRIRFDYFVYNYFCGISWYPWYDHFPKHLCQGPLAQQNPVRFHDSHVCQVQPLLLDENCNIFCCIFQWLNSGRCCFTKHTFSFAMFGSLGWTLMFLTATLGIWSYSNLNLSVGVLNFLMLPMQSTVKQTRYLLTVWLFKNLVISDLLNNLNLVSFCILLYLNLQVLFQPLHDCSSVTLRAVLCF